LDRPDVFQNQFQTAPLDLDTDYFFCTREKEIEERLEEISGGGAIALIRKVWAREGERKTLCVGLSWERFSEEELATIVRCVGGPGLAVIMGLLARDHKHWRSGMPDLVMWKEEPLPAARLVEVKGPRDTLADHQRAWLAELAFAGLDVEVCKILEP